MQDAVYPTQVTEVYQLVTYQVLDYPSIDFFGHDTPTAQGMGLLCRLCQALPSNNHYAELHMKATISSSL